MPCPVPVCAAARAHAFASVRSCPGEPGLILAVRLCVGKIGGSAHTFGSGSEQRHRNEAAGLGRLRPKAGQPKTGFAPAAQPGFPFAALVGYLAEAHFPFGESIARM